LVAEREHPDHVHAAAFLQDDHAVRGPSRGESDFVGLFAQIALQDDAQEQLAVSIVVGFLPAAHDLAITGQLDAQLWRDTVEVERGMQNLVARLRRSAIERINSGPSTAAISLGDEADALGILEQERRA